MCLELLGRQYGDPVLDLKMKWTFPFIKQVEPNECGLVCLRMLCIFYGLNYVVSRRWVKNNLKKDGVSLLDLSQLAESLGFKTRCLEVDAEDLMKCVRFPCLVFYRRNHFVVLLEILDTRVCIVDPAKGILEVEKYEFLEQWCFDLKSLSSNAGQGIIMQVELHS